MIRELVKMSNDQHPLLTLHGRKRRQYIKARKYKLPVNMVDHDPAGITVKVRCMNNKMHRIHYCNGHLHFMDHTFAELAGLEALQAMGTTDADPARFCRCLEIYRVWQNYYVNFGRSIKILPDSLRNAREYHCRMPNNRPDGFPDHSSRRGSLRTSELRQLKEQWDLPHYPRARKETSEDKISRRHGLLMECIRKCFDQLLPEIQAYSSKPVTVTTTDDVHVDCCYPAKADKRLRCQLEFPAMRWYLEVFKANLAILNDHLILRCEWIGNNLLIATGLYLPSLGERDERTYHNHATNLHNILLQRAKEEDPWLVHRLKALKPEHY